MAVIKQGIFGGFSGRVGNVVGTSWKGIAVMKALPLSVANPRTSGQVEQRGKFSLIVVLGSLLLSSIIKPLWDRFAMRMSGYNSFVKQNISLVVSDEITTPEDFRLSVGKMSSTDISSVGMTNLSPLVTVAWSDDAGSGFRLHTDLAFAVVFTANLEKIGYSSVPVARSEESIEFSLNTPAATSDVFFCYLSFMRVDGTIVSTSFYKLKTV